MATIFPTVPVNQNQINQSGALDALILEQFTGEVEHTFVAESVLSQFFPTKPVKGTNTLTKKAIGRTKLQKLQRGDAPDGTQVDFSQAKVVVDTTILSRHSFTELETLQTDIDARKEIAIEQGQEIGEFKDQAIAIQAAKAAAMVNSAYYANGKNPEGHFGATQVEMDAAGDELDPAKLYSKIGNLLRDMELKKVNPRKAGIILIVGPAVFYTLQEAEQIVNGEYLTSQGNKLSDIPMFKAWGIPVISTTNLPDSVITGHLLSNAANGNAYDGDFTTLLALAVGPKALMMGETVPLKSHVWWSDAAKVWFMDSWMAFGVAPDRVEYAGRLDKFS